MIELGLRREMSCARNKGRYLCVRDSLDLRSLSYLNIMCSLSFPETEFGKSVAGHELSNGEILGFLIIDVSHAVRLILRKACFTLV